MRAGLLAMIVAVAATLQAASACAQSPDYEFFKARVEPIFLKKKPGHTRCYVCHAESNNAFRLEKLPPGAKFWTEEQSRRNFETVSRLVVPGNFAASRLLFMPLAPEAGGNAFHNGDSGQTGRSRARASSPRGFRKQNDITPASRQRDALRLIMA
jgi:hypothetical protein